MWIDIQSLCEKALTPKTATMDAEGIVHLYGQSCDQLNADETQALFSLLYRQHIRLIYTKNPDPQGIGKNLRVYDLADAIQTVVSNPPPCESARTCIEKACQVPGRLHMVGKTLDRDDLFGGLTEDRRAFVLVPSPFLDMYYRESFIALYVSEGGRWETEQDAHQMARVLDAQEALVPMSPLVQRARNTAYAVSYWRGLAGYNPITDPCDRRAMR